jgi:hypothetical protein
MLRPAGGGGGGGASHGSSRGEIALAVHELHTGLVLNVESILWSILEASRHLLVTTDVASAAAVA